MGLSIGGGIGPFRASVSRHGVRGGISTGVGPVRYNKTLVSTRSRGGSRTTYAARQGPRYDAYAAPLPRRPDYSAQLPNQLNSTTGAPMVARLRGQSELTELLNQAAHHRSGAIVTSFSFYAMAIGLLFTGHSVLAALAVVTGLISAVTMYTRAAPLREVNVSYALPTDGFATPEQLAAVERHLALTNEWPNLIRAQRVWRRVGRLRLDNPYHQKINAGANHVSERDGVTVGYGRPPHLALESEIATPSLRSGQHALFFLPDRVLAYDARSREYSETSYAQLRVSADTTDYVEDVPTNSLPRDAKRSGTTWLRANRNGGPDRRYAQNYRIPVMRYDALDLACTQTGLRWELIISRPDTARPIAQVLTR